MSLEYVQSLMNQTIRIIVSDGRIIEGQLSCLDKDFNFIVANAVEYHDVSEGLSFYGTFWQFILSFITYIQITGIKTSPRILLQGI